ncbi:MAG: tetratricopeptide repeat protein [Geminicoccaceae bacterium]
MKLLAKVLTIPVMLAMTGCGLLDSIHEKTVRSQLELRAADHEAGDYFKALVHAQNALALANDNLGVEHMLTVDSLLAAAESYDRVHNTERAKKYYGFAVEIRQLTLGPEHPDTLDAMRLLTRFYVSSDPRHDEARQVAEETLALRTKALGKTHRETIESMVDLAEVTKLQRLPDQAEPIYLEAVALSEDVFGEDNVDTLRWRRELGFFFYGQGRYDDAERVYLETIERGMPSLGATHPIMIGFHEDLANVLQGQGRLAEASGLRDRILTWRRAAKDPSR